MWKTFIFRLSCLAWLLTTVPAVAQVAYSTAPDYLRVKSESPNNLFSAWRLDYPDSNITGLQNTIPRNLLGNPGLPSPDYTLRYGTPQLGFRFFEPPTRADRVLDNDILYYRSKGPYAALTGIAGSKQLQFFNMLFTHSYKENLNVTLRLSRYSSLGYYKRQQTYTNNFFLSSNYTATRWGYCFFVLNNSNRNQESGGLRDTLLNDSTNAINKELLPVGLSGASRENREIRVLFNPWWRINRHPDSVIATDHYLTLKSNLAVAMYRYRDPNALTDRFYRQFLIDTAGTVDSSHVRQLGNELGYTLINKRRGISFSAAYRHELNAIWQEGDSLLVNQLLTSALVYRPAFKARNASPGQTDPQFEMQLRGEYVLSGANARNFKWEGTLHLFFDAQRRRSVYVKLLGEQRSPDFIYNQWNSTHFQWFNQRFADQTKLQAEIGLELGRTLRLSVLHQTVNNFLFFDELALPSQSKSALYNNALQLSFNRVVARHLGTAIAFTLQSTSAEDIQRLPQSGITASVFYTGNLFRNNLQLQVGAQVQAWSSFTPYAYMPATQVFYLQNKITTQTYPFADVFLNARIRPVSFFLKLENLLNGRVGNNYALVMGYYQTPLAFRFGLTWVFFD